MMGSTRLRLEQDGERWQLAGADVGRFGLVNEYLAYLADRNYSLRTGRAYGYDLLAFCRWLLDRGVVLDAVTTDSLLDYLRSCREASVPGRPGNVVSLSGVRADRYAPSTINHRLAAVTGLFAFRTLRDPSAPNPVPKGREARRVTARNATVCSGTWQPARSNARRCACGSPGGCHGPWTGVRPPTCSAACGAGGTGPSPG